MNIITKRSSAKNLSVRRNNVRGLTLIELMVSMVIGLLLAILASSAYLYTKQAYNSVSETSQLEENGRMALDLLTRYVQSAGYAAIHKDAKFPARALDRKVTGCEFGMVDAQQATAANMACNTSAPSNVTRTESISIVNETDRYNMTNGSGAVVGKYQGFNCIGNAATVIPADVSKEIPERYVVRSHFFVSNSVAATPFGTTTMGQLSCVAETTLPGAAQSYESAQPLIPGVIQLVATYLTPSTLESDSAQKASTASALELANTWNTVTAVEICVLTKSIQTSGNDTGLATRDCYGDTITAATSQTFRRFSATIKVRNRIGGA